MISCKTCNNSTSLVFNELKSAQRKILNQRSVQTSQYIQNISSLNNYINNTNEGIKYNSYDRYLLKKKGIVLRKQGIKPKTPTYGNKTKSIPLSYYCLPPNCIN